jgi:hypothetical protein
MYGAPFGHSPVASAFALSSPRGQAALYRAMAEIPGVKVKTGVTDAAGRAGIAVTRESEGNRAEVILATGDYRYLGFRLVATRDQKVKARRMADGREAPQPRAIPAGTVLIDQARLAYGIVNRPGQHP